MKKCKQIIAKFIIIYWASHQSPEKKKREKSAVKHRLLKPHQTSEKKNQEKSVVTYRLLKPQRTSRKKNQAKSAVMCCLFREYSVKYSYFHKKVELFCMGKYGTL